jgi:hypothetical protein
METVTQPVFLTYQANCVECEYHSPSSPCSVPLYVCCYLSSHSPLLHRFESTALCKVTNNKSDARKRKRRAAEPPCVYWLSQASSWGRLLPRPNTV